MLLFGHRAAELSVLINTQPESDNSKKTAVILRNDLCRTISNRWKLQRDIRSIGCTRVIQRA